MIRGLVYGIVVLDALTTTIFGVLSLFAPNTFLSIVGVHGEQLTTGTQVFAAYTGARELAIAALLIILLIMRSTRALPALMLVTALANAVDGVHGLITQRWAQVPGAFAFAIIFLAAAIWLFNQPSSGRTVSRASSPRRE